MTQEETSNRAVPATPQIEKPAHVDERRMRHISDEDLFAALDLSRPGLEAVRAAADAQDWQAAYTAWGQYFARRSQPVAVINLDGYARLPAELRQARGQPIIEAALKLGREPVDYTGASHGKSKLYGFHYFVWMQPLLDAYAIERDERHIEAFVRLFNQWYETSDQVAGEIFSLDVIWYTLGLAIRSQVFASAYHAYRQSPLLNPQTHARLLKSFLGASRWLAEEHDSFRFGNWQLTGVASLYEMAIFWPEFRESDAWRQIARPRMLEHLELDVYLDGGHSERAPSYHKHVMACFARAASVAELNGQPPLQQQPRFHQMYRWLLDQTTPLGCSTNFNDSHLVWVGSWAVQGAALLADPELKWLAEKYGTAEDIGWTLAGLPNRPNGQTAAQAYQAIAARQPLRQSKVLASSKFALLTSGSGPDDLFMAINYGPLVGHEYESHSHLDALSFVCSGYGVPLAVEAGLPLLTYDDPLYKNWIPKAAAHNMVVVDGQDPDENNKEGDLLFWSTSPVADLFEAEHSGYQAIGVRHRRLILFVKSEYWIMRDEMFQAGAHRFDWLLYTPQAIDIQGGWLEPTQFPGLVVLPVHPGESGRFEAVHGVMAIPGPRAFEGTHEFVDTPGVSHVQETGAARTAYLHVLYPARDERQAAQARAAPATPSAGSGAAATISTDQGQDIFFVRDSSAAAHLIEVQGWQSDARIAWMRSRRWFSVYEAGSLAVRGQPVFESSWPLRCLSLWPEGEGAAGTVEAARRTELTLHADWPIGQVFLNGVRLPEPLATGQSAHIPLPSLGLFSLRIMPRLSEEQ
jgi:hypothetical protein